MTDPVAPQDPQPVAGDGGKRRKLPPRPIRRPLTPARRVAKMFGSFGMAMSILAMLLLLTFLGTMDQQTRGLYDVQKDYFESWFHISTALSVPIPVIGAIPLLGLLFINLMVGGIMRMRNGVSTVGILIAHIGISVLLLGGLVEHLTSTNGNMLIRPGGSKDTFESYYDWEVRVSVYTPDGKADVYVLPDAQFKGLGSGDQARFHHDELPFRIVLTTYHRNGVPVQAPPTTAGAVDGWLLRGLRPEDKAELNAPVVRATIVEPDGAEEVALLWGGRPATHVFERAGQTFGLSLGRKQFQLPFAIKLDRFVKADHPGTLVAREYSSYVQKLDDGVSENVHITMNEPLRHRGYILYQSSFQKIGTTPDGGTLYATVLAVSDNPADRIPELACYIITFGLLWHFGRKLSLHIMSESRRAEQAAAAAEAAEATEAATRTSHV